MQLNPAYKKFTIWQTICYYVLFALWYIFSKLPMWLLYAISTIVAEFLYVVVRYRRKLVRKNLTDSFPNMSKRQIWLIEHRFYLHFCDIMFESVKYLSISRKEIRKRLRFEGVELIEESARNGKSCAVYLGHYANWEWISSLPLWVNMDIIKPVQLYHPLENPLFDRLIRYTRERLGSTNIAANESLRHIVKYRKEGKPLVIGFIADQTPHWNNIHYWTNFLNHPETPVFSGPERLIRQLHMDVYYMDVRRMGRGKYVAEFKRITTTPEEYPEYGLTEIYTRMLETTIQRQPSYWLWSHNRWKRTKAEWEYKKSLNHVQNKQ